MHALLQDFCLHELFYRDDTASVMSSLARNIALN